MAALCYTNPLMKLFTFRRSFPFIVALLVVALLLASVWVVLSASPSQTETITATATEITPTLTAAPTPVVPQSADTSGITLFALALLLVILGGMALGWRLTVAKPKTAAIEKEAKPSVGERSNLKSKKRRGR